MSTTVKIICTVGMALNSAYYVYVTRRRSSYLARTRVGFIAAWILLAVVIVVFLWAIWVYV